MHRYSAVLQQFTAFRPPLGETPSSKHLPTVECTHARHTLVAPGFSHLLAKATESSASAEFVIECLLPPPPLLLPLLLLLLMLLLLGERPEPFSWPLYTSRTLAYSLREARLRAVASTTDWGAPPGGARSAPPPCGKARRAFP